MNNIKIKKTKTELHTHLMGMLTAKEFLNLIQEYSDYIYWPLNITENENSTYVSTDNLSKNVDAIRSISIPLGESRPYEEGLKSLYRNRSELLSFVVRYYAFKNNINELDAQKIIYNDYFNRCLLELINNGVKYVEISFANYELIESFVQSQDTKDKINYTFLLCTQRTNKIGPSMQEKIRNAYNKGIAVGFDFMGMETPLDQDELKKTGRKSYYRKIKAVLETLIYLPKSVFRIHSGESKGTEENTENIFKIIDEIKEENGYEDFPPPEMRIGHGIHYEKSDYYYNFMKKNHVIVEINAVSNLALSNIDSIDDLPYIDYLSHGIPIAISTDGHGAYSTTTIIEDKIAFYNYLKDKNKNAYRYLLDSESQYMERKIG